MQILYVLPDYFEQYPKPCYGGWGKLYLVVTPDGSALPCHGATQITTLRFDNVRDHSLEWIWQESPAFQAFRGDDWMQEPCRSCPRKAVDFGGCRCQAFALTGDADEHRPGLHAVARAAHDRQRAVEHAGGDRWSTATAFARRAAAGMTPAPRSKPRGSGATTADARARRARPRRVTAARWSACWAPTAPARPRRCSCSPRCWRRRAAGARSSATTSSASARRCAARLGLVFQETSVDGLLTVEENLRFAARLPGSAAGWRAPAVADGDRAHRARRPRAPARAAALRRLAPTDRHRPRHAAPARPPHPRRADRRPRPRAPRRDLGAARRRAPRPRNHDPVLHPLPGGSRAGRPGRAAGRTAGSWPTTPRRRSGASWASEVAEIEGPAPSDSARALRGLGVGADGAPNRARIPGRHRGRPASRSSSWRAARRASSGSRCAPRRWRTSTSRAPRAAPSGSPRRTAPSPEGAARERLERRPRHRRARPVAHDSAEEPAARRSGPAVHVAAAGRHRLQRHRPAGGRPVRTRRSSFPASWSWRRSSAGC